VRSDAPYRTFKELVDFGKKNPGAVRIGTPGAGSLADFCIEVIKGVTEAELSSTPFKGGSPAVAALRGAHIEGVLLALGALASHIKGGTVRALVVSNKFPEFPDIPTMTGLGYRQDMFGIWFAFFAPAGVPAEVTKTLVPAIEQAVRSPQIAAKLLPIGIVQDYAPPDKLAAEMRAEYRAIEAIAKSSGLIK
jgi:tripartite-type tricarboxylate transporter receptor subunit TctC